MLRVARVGGARGVESGPAPGLKPRLPLTPSLHLHRLGAGPEPNLVRGVGLLHGINEIGAVLIAQHDGVPVHLRDVADVRESFSASAWPRGQKQPEQHCKRNCASGTWRTVTAGFGGSSREDQGAELRTAAQWNVRLQLSRKAYGRIQFL